MVLFLSFSLITVGGGVEITTLSPLALGGVTHKEWKLFARGGNPPYAWNMEVLECAMPHAILSLAGDLLIYNTERNNSTFRPPDDNNEIAAKVLVSVSDSNGNEAEKIFAIVNIVDF